MSRRSRGYLATVSRRSRNRLATVLRRIRAPGEGYGRGPPLRAEGSRVGVTRLVPEGSADIEIDVVIDMMLDKCNNFAFSDITYVIIARVVVVFSSLHSDRRRPLM